ncbi:TfuA-like protein [Streptomyces sp. NPDC006285]|uniref:TfuA-like protein n=1 Tax=Streptomyces sp. NPDC006285 TaxID=3364742 RepID=UPI0036ABBA34
MLHIFVGPTLTSEDLEQFSVIAVLHPPIRHGDLLTLPLEESDTIVILDGLYHQTTALRHKEILYVLGKGVRVIGAGSIGALRASELDGLGMIGVGDVYRAYRDGLIEGDDEVAVAHAPSGSWSALNLPLVNVRKMILSACSEGIVTTEQGTRLLEEFRSIFYPQRSAQAVTHRARQAGQSQFAAWLETKLTYDRNFCNQKRVDALEAVALAQTPHRGKVESPILRAAADRNWRTVHFREWHAHFHTSDINGKAYRSQDRLWFQQIFDPNFHAVWRDFLEFYSQYPADDSPGLPLAARLDALYGTDMADGENAGAKMVWTIFRPRIEVCSELYHKILFRHEVGDDIRTLDRYLCINQEFQRKHPRWSTEWIRRDVAARLLAELWNIEGTDIEGESRRRGFHTFNMAVKAFSRFALGYLDDVQKGSQ